MNQPVFSEEGVSLGCSPQRMEDFTCYESDLAFVTSSYLTPTPTPYSPCQSWLHVPESVDEDLLFQLDSSTSVNGDGFSRARTDSDASDSTTSSSSTNSDDFVVLDHRSIPETHSASRYQKGWVPSRPTHQTDDSREELADRSQRGTSSASQYHQLKMKYFRKLETTAAPINNAVDIAPPRLAFQKSKSCDDLVSAAPPSPTFSTMSDTRVSYRPHRRSTPIQIPGAQRAYRDMRVHASPMRPALPVDGSLLAQVFAENLYLTSSDEESASDVEDFEDEQDSQAFANPGSLFDFEF